MADEQQTDSSILVTAAKAIGKTAGKIASIGTPRSAQSGAGQTSPQSKPATPQRPGKLPKKNKSRLPRKEKKAQKKAAAARQA